ncbi:MAG: 3-hydroxyacyl-CoA dehydrogenase family protein [Deltaproteobacteria bacterium]
MSDERIAVIGAGTMGHGIAQVAAQAGFATRLCDPDAAALERGLGKARAGIQKALEKGKLSPEEAALATGRLAGAASLAEAVREATLVIEAGPENLAVKCQILRDVCDAAPAGALIASNSSSLSLTELAAATPRAAQIVGMHFFNPPPVMKLVELVRAEQTSTETLARARAIAAKMGKEVVEVRDSPGFASSRLGIALAMEAIRMLEEGVASAEDIDRAMELGYNHPMGPLRLTDLVGLDVRLAIADHLNRELGGLRFQAPQLLRRLVRAGKLGRKTGEGFYRYG